MKNKYCNIYESSLKCWTANFCIHASEGPVIITHQHSSPFKDSNSQPIHTCASMTVSNVLIIHSRIKFPNLKFQLKERGYSNIDAIDGSEGMLKKAEEKEVYKNCITAMLGPTSIEGIKRGLQRRI